MASGLKQQSVWPKQVFTSSWRAAVLEKAEAAKANVLSRIPSASLEILALDLSDLTSVRAFAQVFRARYSTLDVLINNAGILLYSAQTNADGVELQFATNHLGHFLLTALLIDMFPDDPASRIVSLSSIAHKNANIHFDDLTCGQDGGVAYGQSKLACLLFGDELDRRLKAAGKALDGTVGASGRVGLRSVQRFGRSNAR